MRNSTSTTCDWQKSLAVLSGCLVFACPALAQQHAHVGWWDTWKSQSGMQNGDAGMAAAHPDDEHAAKPIRISSPEPIVERGNRWRVKTNFENWLYGGYNRNPQYAWLPKSHYAAEVRLDVEVRRDNLKVVLGPRASWVENCTSSSLPGSRSCQSADPQSWNQLFASYARGSQQILIGREKFTWGPATFRSPSHPIYFDSGKTNPLSDTPGIDLARWTISRSGLRFTGAFVSDTKALPQTRQRNMGLIKIDRQGQGHLASLIVSQAEHESTFIGGFFQSNVGKAWLAYAEAASVPANGVDIQKRAYRWTVGTSYTHRSGHIISGELLYNGAGRGGVSMPRDRLMAVPELAAALRSRRYLWAGWQSNPQDLRHHWRLEWTHNLDDKSHQLMAYGEKRITDRVASFFTMALNGGRARTEFRDFYDSLFTVGLKVFLF